MKKYFIWILIVFAALFIMRACIQDQESFSCDGSTVIVQKGDDVWGLIEKHCSGNLEMARHHIVTTIGGPFLQPEQVIIMSNK